MKNALHSLKETPKSWILMAWAVVAAMSSTSVWAQESIDPGCQDPEIRDSLICPTNLLPTNNPSITVLGGLGSPFSGDALLGWDGLSADTSIDWDNSQEIGARVNFPTWKKVLGGDLDLAIQGFYSRLEWGWKFPGESTGYKVKSEWVRVQAWPVLNFDLKNGYGADIGAFGGYQHSDDSISFTGDSWNTVIKSENQGFSWEVVGGLSKELAQGFSARIETAVGNQSGYSIQGGDNGWFLKSDSDIGVTFRGWITKKF